MSLKKHMLRHGPQIGVLAASIGALVATGGLSTTAWAQEQEEEDADTTAAEESAQTDDIIIVTGTRIRRDDFSSPNATTVMTADDMRALGVISAADMINQLPNNVGSTTPEATAGSPFNVGASIANLRGLNTFFGTRTLTMVDSRRVVASNNGGGVDLNFVPSALVGRIETVTGGAGATYGADAMAGVVNVVLDTNIEGYRLNLGYQTTQEGDGDRYDFSFATGTEVLDGKGQFTISLDYEDQAAINDCFSREYCRENRGILRNGEGVPAGFFQPPPPYSERRDIVFEGEPQWLLLDGMHHTLLTEGLVFEDGQTTDCPTDPGLPGALTCGKWRFTPDGTDVIPYLDGLTAEQTLAVDGEGQNGVTPWGEGKSPYASVPLIPGRDTTNIFSRFTYGLESGIEIQADLRLGESNSTVIQQATRQNMQPFCIRSDNGFLQQGSQLMQDLFAARWMSGVFTPGNFMGLNDWAIECDEPPFMGGSFRDDREDGRFDFAPGTVMYKDLSDQLARQNTIDSQSGSFLLSANGDLFEGGSWTWDTYLEVGKSERSQHIQRWVSDNRLQMAVDSVVDPQTGEIVCRIDSSDPSYEKYELYPAQGITEPTLQPGTDDIGDKWRLFYTLALREEYPESELAAAAANAFDTMRQGCTPFNPFGNGPIPQDVLDFAFPTIVDNTDITQNAVELSFSGELHQGIGAGPLLMAAGVDWREEETINTTASGDSNLARDFLAFEEALNTGFNVFGDDWAGLKTDTELFVELEMPFLSGKTAAEYLMVNVAQRRTQTKSDPIQVRDLISTTGNTFYVDSWKASMVWQPVDIMRVRMTRSSDTRAPSSRELFQTNTGAQQAGGQNEILSPFRVNIPQSITGDFENGEQYENISGGNAKLDPETSLTETLGIVFTPSETLSGLEVAIDYYETSVFGGIETVSSNGTINRCAQNEVGPYYIANPDAPPLDPTNFPESFTYCNNVAFGVPDLTQVPIMELYGCGGNPLAVPPIPGCTEQQIAQQLPFTNIEAIASSFENASPYFNRGVDLSVSFNHQLSGGGVIYARVLATRFLEQTVDLGGQGDPEDFANVAGQTGSNGLTNFRTGSFGINYSPTPRISGNAFMSYNRNAWTVAAQVRYIGKGRLNIQDGWIGEGESATYYQGGVQQTVAYDPNLLDTSDGSAVPSFATWNLNLSYDFTRSQADFGRFEALSVFLNIENVADRIPGFFSGRDAGGLNTTFFSGLGRQFHVGARMEF